MMTIYISEEPPSHEWSRCAWNEGMRQFVGIELRAVPKEGSYFKILPSGYWIHRDICTIICKREDRRIPGDWR